MENDFSININDEYATSDVVLASYLRTKGYGIIGTNTSGKIVSFVFEGKVKELAQQWQLNPTKEMKLVKESHQEREMLYKLIKETSEGYYGSKY